MPEGTNRCGWAGDDPRMVAYHDTEWGLPSHDDKTLFEFLILEGAQAGLSWSTILNKRDGYRTLFADFDAATVARFTPARVERLLQDASIVRNRAKVNSAVSNAEAFLAIQAERGSFDQYLWSFVDGVPITNKWARMSQIPAETPLSVSMSKDLKERGFRFVGPTIMYAYIQSVGLVNDHLVSCFRWKEV